MATEETKEETSQPPIVKHQDAVETQATEQGVDPEVTEEDAIEVAPAADTLNGMSPQAMASDDGLISVQKTYRNKRILVTGSTGFLAKVVVSMILRYHPDIEQLYLVIRSRRNATAQERFQTELVECEAFQPIHDIYGAGVADFLKEKVTVIAGDITDEYLGMTEEEARALSGTLDLFINSAGLTNFNPNLENALRINTLSEKNILRFLELGDCRCALMHVSTCFVAGNTQKPTPEVLPLEDIYPAHDELGMPFDVHREIEDCFRLIDYTKHLAEDQEQESAFRKTARDKLKSQNLSPYDTTSFEKAYADAKADWIKKYLSQQGRKRAAHWGWPNIYTYTKSMGERLLTEQRDRVNFSIVRPAIIESSVSFPVKGWNEGINTTAPLTYLRYKGHMFFPSRAPVALDIIPVDYVCGAMLAIGAALIHKRAEHIYQLGSSDLNRLGMERIVELTTLASRKLRASEVKTPQWKKTLMNSLEAKMVDEKTYNKRSAPGVRKLLTSLNAAIDQAPTKSMGGIGKALKSLSKTTKSFERMTFTLEKMFEIFMPFVYHNTFTFRARNVVKMANMLIESERELYGADIEALNWHDYWINIHIPGLAKYVYPNLEDKLSQSTKDNPTYQDLVELFDASTNNFRDSIALQHHHNYIVERYTYDQLRQNAERAAQFLHDIGVRQNSAVLLISENRPQWAMTYFGILKAGGVAVPVDPESNVEKITNLATTAHAQVVVLSQAVSEKLGQALPDAFEALGRTVRILTFPQLFALQLTAEDIGTIDAPNNDDMTVWDDIDHNLASLIFTSGTTGTPKGVMLTHDNFTELLTSMQQVFRISERDGFLSVLPLHHTFEFTCGLLMPLSKGSTITYLEELNGDQLNSALAQTPITAMIGVPALWQLLNRRIDQRIQEAPPLVRWMLEQLLRLNRATRQRFGVNLGPTVFAAIHRAFGGRIRYLISGGAALPGELLKSFYGMGFNMYEGYGLTEAAPVLTVSKPDRRLLPGSVGQPLPGVEIQIKNPNDEGVGEVIARGGNVMVGYLNRDDDTQRALRDGWLHTGDLGKLDKHGNLTIVGREKDVIVTSGGKNVYPDELEELYGTNNQIEELSVVGLPDGRGSERVASLIRVKYIDGESGPELAQRKAEVREWIRVEGSRVAPHERIQVLRFWDEELPRTATRKIQRKGVIEILDRLIKAEQELHEQDAHAEEWLWLDKLIATLADVQADNIYPYMHLQDDLGFDSLMFVELASVLEARGYHLSAEQLSQIGNIEALRRTLDGTDGEMTALVPVKQGTLQRVDEYNVPKLVSKQGKNWLHNAQMQSYNTFFDVKVNGKHNIPQHNRNVIVISNHCSHLDMGLVKYSLGQYGANIRALAAADYFYKNKTRKTYFKNFTNLIPIERSGNLETSLSHASEALKRGEMILVFPEGTRSKNGKLQPFRRGIGYLMTEHQVDILPVHIEGTYRAFPKGAKLPNPAARNLDVTIGQVLNASQLLKESEGMSPTDRYQYIADAAQKAVEALRDGTYKSAKNQKKLDLEEIFNSLYDKFIKDQIDTEVYYYFSLGKGDDQKWTVRVDHKSCDVALGKPSDASCIIKTTPEMLKRMIMDSYTPSIDEFMNGTVKTNDPALLLRFQAVFGL